MSEPQAGLPEPGDRPRIVAPVVQRYRSADELVDDAASRLLRLVVERQAHRDAVHLCLSGGHTANRLLSRFAEVASSGDELDAGKLHVWWSDDLFVPTIDADRNAVQTLSVLGGRLHLNSSQIHPMPASDGNDDPGESAFAYAEELGDTVFDLCLLGIGSDGHVASIFPHHPSSESTSKVAIGVEDAPKPPSERISLTVGTLNRSREVWFVTTGAEKADAVAASLSGDQALPAAQVHGAEATVWFVDRDAAAMLPRHECEL